MTGNRLTSKQVREIQQKYKVRAEALEATKDFTVRELAKTYGCHVNTIMRYTAYMREEVDGSGYKVGSYE